MTLLEKKRSMSPTIPGPIRGTFIDFGGEWYSPGGGGGGVLLGILGGGVPPGSPNPDPISEQNIPFSTPVFRPGL